MILKRKGPRKTIKAKGKFWSRTISIYLCGFLSANFLFHFEDLQGVIAFSKMSPFTTSYWNSLRIVNLQQELNIVPSLNSSNALKPANDHNTSSPTLPVQGYLNSSVNAPGSEPSNSTTTDSHTLLNNNETEIYSSSLTFLNNNETENYSSSITFLNNNGTEFFVNNRPEACYRVAKNNRCALASCPGMSAPGGGHFRGPVRDISKKSALRSPKRRGTCKVCRVYTRQCAVSKTHKFIFLHVMKSGGSSFYQFLRSALCTVVPPESRKRFNCSEDQLEMMYCSKAVEIYPDFFKWSFVRHPFSRAISGWSMASSRAIGPQVPFNDWVMNTSSMKTRVYSMHWWPQTSFLFDEGMCPMFDFLGTLGKTFLSDLEYILSRIRSDALWKYYKANGFPHENKASSALDEVKRNVTEAVKDQLVKQFNEDFTLFGFLPSEWEP